MNLEEIVNRHNSRAINQDEALYVIKAYIKERKGVDVNPVIETRYGSMFAQMELHRMIDMYSYAIAWFRNNKGTWSK